MRHSVFFYMLFAFLATCLIGTSVFSTYEFFISEGPLQSRKEVMIDKGMPLRKIANHLKKEGIIESSAIFVLGVRANGNGLNLKAGEYSIPARASAKMVMDILTGGQTFIRRVTIPEGLTSYQIVQILNKTDGLTGELTNTPKDGTLLPQTYYFSKGDTKQQLIQRMQNAMKRTIDELWPTRVPDLSIKTPEQAITLASIVEKETSIPAERAHVASVFLNRLNKRMRLQSDPTVIYGLSKGTGIYKRKLWSNDLKRPHPYNTYYIYGLPPGAIANPGKEAIEAVLQPLKTKDLYFVADGTGGHVFSETYAEHQKKVSEWRQIKNNAALRKLKRKQKKMQTIPVVPVAPKMDNQNANELSSDSIEEKQTKQADEKNKT